MERIVKVVVSKSVYKFYQDAARNVSGSSPEDIMSDALGLYAGMLSKEIAKERESALSEQEHNIK